MANMDDEYSTFEQCYRCYPVSFIDKAHLEKGDKIIMPPSALDRLASLHIQYPMLFKLTNTSVGRITHCGVLEFIADEGIIYLPYWMMQNMLLQEGDILQVRNASLAKGTYVKLQPHTTDFLDISNPKAILETTLRSYSCLTAGDTIMVSYNNKEYYIDIVETKPCSAISIIETDCEVDFAPPLDYKEPEKPKTVLRSNKRQAEVEPEQETSSKTQKFTPFNGLGKRLDGKACTELAAPVTNPVIKQALESTENLSNSLKALNSTSSALNSTSSAVSGKLVFGSKGENSVKEKAKNNRQEITQEVEKPKFKAFSGKKYSLLG